MSYLHDENRFQYNGKELEKDFGINLHDYGARWYDASIGWWTSVDPLASDYSSWSPYNYTKDNPINMIDSDGRAAEWIDNGDGTYTAQDGDSAWSLHEETGVSFEKAKEIMDYNGHGVYTGADGEDKSDIHPGETIVDVDKANAILKKERERVEKMENEIIVKVDANVKKVKRYEKTLDSIDFAIKEHSKMAQGQRDGLGERNPGAAFWALRRIYKLQREASTIHHKKDSINVLNKTLVKPLNLEKSSRISL